MTETLRKELLELTEYLLGDTKDKEVIEVYADTITNFAKKYHTEQLELCGVTCSDKPTFGNLKDFDGNICISKGYDNIMKLYYNGELVDVKLYNSKEGVTFEFR